MDVLHAGGLTAEVTFGEMTTRSLDGCNAVDGIMGMGPSNSGDHQSVFEDLVDVSETATTLPENIITINMAGN